MSTNATGIAGAMEHAQPVSACCWICGGAMDRAGTRPYARAWPGLGVVQACSTVCSEDTRFKYGPTPHPQEFQALRDELEQLRTHNRRLSAAVVQLTAAVITARDTFDSYAAHHQAKGTPEAIAKGLKNDALMMEMAAALEGFVPHQEPAPHG